MLQRMREATGRRVNLVHRLDRGCSGCLLAAFADSEGATAALSESLQEGQKTYVALVRGEGILRGRDFRKEGWFLVDREIKDESGQLNTASTWFRFVAGQDGVDSNQPRASLVLARPTTGRWHQIRRHLNGLSHPILGDSSHGNSRTNREWRSQRGLLPERTCLHLTHVQLSSGLDVTAPLAVDMMELLEQHMPRVLEQAVPILETEGVHLWGTGTSSTVPFEVSLSQSDLI